MPMVVTEPCLNCVNAHCVAVCPVDAFHRGPTLMVIDPDECIDCYACIEECPTDAIFERDDVPEQWTSYVELNREMSQVWPLARDAE